MRQGWSGSSPCTATRAPTSARSACAAGRSPAPPTSCWCACTAPAGTPPGRTSPPTSCTRSARWSPSCRRRCPAGSTRGPALSLVWGRVGAGRAANAIPTTGEVEGTVRCLDAGAWHGAPELVEVAGGRRSSRRTASRPRSPTPATSRRSTTSRPAWTLLAAAVRETEGPDAVVGTEQSLGGEDFAWYLPSVPGALARLGVSPPEVPVEDRRDLHQGAVRRRRAGHLGGCPGPGGRDVRRLALVLITGCVTSSPYRVGSGRQVG